MPRIPGAGPRTRPGGVRCRLPRARGSTGAPKGVPRAHFEEFFPPACSLMERGAGSHPSTGAASSVDHDSIQVEWEGWRLHSCFCEATHWSECECGFEGARAATCPPEACPLASSEPAASGSRGQREGVFHEEAAHTGGSQRPPPSHPSAQPSFRAGGSGSHRQQRGGATPVSTAVMGE